MKVFVTGATGFLGSRLLARLLDRGVEVNAMSRSAASLALAEKVGRAHSTGRLLLYHCDLRQIDGCAAGLEDCDAVYHLASDLTGSAASLFLNNVVYTRRLIDACVKYRVRRLVLVSSIAVYGSQALTKWSVLDETCPLEPQPHRRDLYTYSKTIQEQLARNSCEAADLPLVVVRPGVIYGPERDCLTARVGLRYGKTLVRLGGRQPLPYTHVENCAEAVLLAGTTPGIEGESFNVVDDNMPSARQLIRHYRRAVGRVRVVPLPQMAIRPISSLCEKYHAWSRGQLPAVLTPYKSDAMWKPLRYSNAKAKSRLGWSQSLPTQDGIAQTLATIRRNNIRSLTST